jgi:hypothetical protein
MVLRCKLCGKEISLTERESSQIAQDLDRRLSWDEQAHLTLVATCGSCWHFDGASIDEAHSGRRVRVISASSGTF